jgi:hypothetical protein
MSCDAVAVTAAAMLAALGPAAPPAPTPGAAEAPPAVVQVTTAAAPATPAPVVATPPSVAREPLFRDIVRRARSLKSEVDGYLRLHAASTAALPNYADFRTRVGELATLDMQGHTTLTERGVTDDLKCILRGISQDLPTRLQALEAATTVLEREDALREMQYLLNDNVEVITSPPRPAA